MFKNYLWPEMNNPLGSISVFQKNWGFCSLISVNKHIKMTVIDIINNCVLLTYYRSKTARDIYRLMVNNLQ